ncbi:MAG: hypothetical protein ACI39G_06725 [Pseudoramibacter sp.]
MRKLNFKFMIDGTEWQAPHLQRMAYERNLHMLHSLRRHGIEVKQGDRVLDDDAIDFLTEKEAWTVSVDTRASLSDETTQRCFAESFKKSEAYWKARPFGQDLPMRKSYCYMGVQGVTLNDYMGVMNEMTHNARLILRSHPEHMNAIETPEHIIGIEPFGTYGTPTLCIVKRADISEMGPRIQDDSDPAFPVKTAGRAYLLDGTTEINSPFHQFRETSDGFEAKLAVYWPEKVPDEIVKGHSLHLAMEFYESLRYIEEAGASSSRSARA